jgi:hypothetical protein
VDIKSLPTYLLKPLPRSRVRGHVQTMAMFHFRTDAFAVEFAVCENVFASRRYSKSEGGWQKWTDHKLEDHAAALVMAKENQTDLVKRKYWSLTDMGLLLPLNETDVRHLRKDGLCPRAMLEYGSELFKAIADWRHSEVEKLETAIGSPSAPPAPATMPTAGAPVSPASGGSMTDVLENLRKRGQALGVSGS